MSKELPSCSGCEHEYECVNMVCFYELLEKEKQKIRADAIDDAIEMIGNNFDFQELYLPIHIAEKLQELKEQRNE